MKNKVFLYYMNHTMNDEQIKALYDKYGKDILIINLGTVFNEEIKKILLDIPSNYNIYKLTSDMIDEIKRYVSENNYSVIGFYYGGEVRVLLGLYHKLTKIENINISESMFVIPLTQRIVKSDENGVKTSVYSFQRWAQLTEGIYD